MRHRSRRALRPRSGHPSVRHAPFLLLLAALLFAPLALAAPPATPGASDAPPPGSVTAAEATGRVEAQEVQTRIGPLFAPVGDPILENAVEGYRIRFATTTRDGRPAEVAAMVFLPTPDETDGPLPAYVFGAGTTGLATICAPSREAEYDPTLGFYGPYAMSYAARGFAVILPDYLGFDEEGRYQPYFDGVAEAHVMLDAIRALHVLLGDDIEGSEARAVAPGTPVRSDVELTDAVFTAGYSQGGHAAFAAADLRPSYAPEVPLAGMIGFGATTNVERLLREGPYYAPYIALAYQQQFGIDPADMLATTWLDDLDAIAGGRCVDRAQQIYPFSAERIYAPDFRQALYGGTLERDFPEIHAALEANRTGLAGHGLPGLLVQGGDDIIVRDPTQERFVLELCEAGSPGLYLRFPGVRHRYTRPAGFEASIGWMKLIAAGETPLSSCPEGGSD